MGLVAAVRILPDVETERLACARWLHPDDAPGLVAVDGSPEVARFVNADVPFTAAQSHLASERVAGHWAAYGFGLWSLRPRRATAGDGRLLGFAGVCHPLWLPEYAHLVEVGWRLHRDAWGRQRSRSARVSARSRRR